MSAPLISESPKNRLVSSLSLALTTVCFLFYLPWSIPMYLGGERVITCLYQAHMTLNSCAIPFLAQIPSESLPEFRSAHSDLTAMAQ
jgi:hypothetical protein